MTGITSLKRGLPAAMSLALLFSAALLSSGCGTALTGILTWAVVSTEDKTEYEPPPSGPAVSSVMPDRGGLAGGTVVTVYGMNFVNGCTVGFGASQATDVVFISSSSVSCKTPASAAAGPVEVMVTNPGGVSGTVTGTFVYANWWYLEWTYRRPVTLTNGTASALADYQAEIAVAYDADMKSDFGDLRFTFVSSGQETAVPFWMESSNPGVSAVFWVKAPSIPASGSATLYAYYGNPAALSASDFDATFTKTPSGTGLAGLWHLDEASGLSAADSSGGGNSGTLMNFAAPHGWLGLDGGQWAGRSDVRFAAGSGLAFDGRDDVADMGNGSGFAVTSAFTVEAWIKADCSWANGREQVIAAKWKLDDGFWNPSRWAYYDAGANPPGAVGGYAGGAFDGRYVYFAPFRNPGYHGEVLRYDTRADLQSASSYLVYDPGTQGLGTDLKGYRGAVFDGRYVYFVPDRNPTAPHGNFLRYDTQAQFDALASWSVFDPGLALGSTWQSGANMIASRRASGCAEAGGRIYVIGGNDGTGNVSEVYEFNPSSNSWLQFPSDMPTARQLFGCAVLNGKIYAVGGDNGGAIATVEEFTPGASTPWASVTAMPGARRYLTCAAVNGKIYVFGGHNGAAYTPVVYEFDPTVGAGGTWTSKSTMPTSRQSMSCAVVGGKVYVIGGFNGAYLATVEMYDPATDLWSTKSPMPTAREHFACAAVNGRIYAIGGYNGTYRAEVEEYDPVLDAWSTETAMPGGARSQVCGTAYNGRMYVFGGRDGVQTSLTRTEIYDPAADGLGANPKGYGGCAFDGRYVYFAPFYNGVEYHGEMLRYDTLGTFNSKSSWTSFRADRYSAFREGGGYHGAVFDGRYMYYIPFSNGAASFHGEIARYDTNGDFGDPSSWKAFDPGYGTNGADGFDLQLGMDLDGYFGAAFDGKYIYFAPFDNGTARHGAVLRFDTDREFQNLSSWTVFDPGFGTNGSNGLDALYGIDLDGFTGASFDGRYVIFTAYFNGSDSCGAFLRYDTLGSFNSIDSWTCVDPGSAWFDGPGPPVTDLDGFHGAVSDGRRTYFAPYYAGAGKAYNAQVLRYDSSGDDSSFRLSWSAYPSSGGLSGGCPGLAGIVNTASGTFTASAKAALSAGEWHHAALTYDGAAISLYADGAVAATAAASGNVAASSAPFTLGAIAGGMMNFAGSMDEARFWSRALSAGEIRAQFERRAYAPTEPSAAAGAEETRP